MARKLAITISGAVSLGSYEAGVIFEIFDAIAQHNQWAEANNQPNERMEVDVLTGASAGGMSAAVIAQRLLYDGASMAGPYNNSLYDAWVTSVDIEGLLARGSGEDVSHSLLSSDFVIGISKRLLTERYANPLQPLPAARPHSALPADQTVHLGLALSNLNGVDYSRTTLSGKEFTYTRHEDQFVRDIQQTAGDRADLWESIRAAAVACGAFPVAFRVQDLVRNLSEYTSPWVDPAIWGGQVSTTFTYTDGGVFQNEPIGMAKNLVERIPGARLNAFERGYLYIAPKQKNSIEVKNSPDPKIGFDAATANFRTLGTRLAGSVVGQSEFQDWSVAEGFNDKLALLDLRAGELENMFSAGTLTPTATLPVSGMLLNAFFSVNGQMTQAANSNLAAARNQLRKQYSDNYQRLGGAGAVADAWLDTVLVLELAADLHDKEEMLIYDFVAQPELLASTGLMAFAGFFDVSYRKHDYDYGRSVAQKNLGVYQKLPDSVFANLHWTPKPIDPLDPRLNGIQMADVDQSKREQVYRQVCGAADQLLKELDMNVAIREPLMLFFVHGQIKKLLAL